MSIQETVQKLWPFMRRYRGRLYVSFLFAWLVGILWGANFSVVYPMTTVLMEGNLQEYVDTQIDELQGKIRDSATQVTDLDQKIDSGTLSESTQSRYLDSRAEHQERTARLTRSMNWMIWSKVHILPWVPSDQFQTVALLFGLLLFATAVKGICIVIQGYLVGSVVELTTINIRKACFRKCLALDQQSLALEGTPALMSRFTFDLQQLSTGLSVVCGRLSKEPIKALSCFAFAMFVNWRLVVLSLVFLPVMGFVFRKFGKKVKTASHSMMDNMSRIYLVLEETLNSIRIVIGFGNQRSHRQAFHAENKKYYHKAMKIRMIEAMTNPTVELMGFGAIFITVVPCMYLLLKQTTTIWGVQLANEPPDIPSLMLLYTFLMGAVDPIRKLSGIYPTVKRAIVAAERLTEFLESDTLVENPTSPLVLPLHQKSVTFENIRFAYATKEPGDRPNALRGVNLEVKHGECVVVVGENGSGKSTLVNLLPRFYDPDQGSVMIDGVDIQKVSLKELRSQLGVVTQDTMLFHTTIYENIRYGKKNATQMEIERAAQQAGVTSFLDQLPDGYQTMIGEKGAGLSGGQRQRIALARAIVRQPSILILDEATSAIDSHSEHQIQVALKAISKTCTTFIITHAVNATLLDFATKIVVMHEGAVIASGSHSQLLETCPIYHNLYQAQVTQRAA